LLRYCLVIVVAVSCAGPAHAWPGFTWEEWHEISQEEAPALRGPQAGHGDLLPLLQRDFESETRIDTVAAWEQKRAGIRAVLDAILLTPNPPTPPDAPVRELGREEAEHYERVHLMIPAEADDEIPAYLLLPKARPAERGPAMIVLHQTQAPGKQEACGMVGDPDMAFAHELAERGILCIAPDAIGFGERILPGRQPYDNALDFYREHQNWSYFGKMNYDLSRVVDYLLTRDDVDPARIGVIGHSHGAYGAIMGAVYEPRIALVVASCGFTTFRTDPHPDRWSHRTALMPRIGFFAEDIHQLPLDWHEIVACLAPRPFFNWATLEDSIFPNTENIAEIHAQLGALYALHGAEDRLEGHLVPGAHSFPPEGREQAYAWIREQFDLP